MGLLLLLIWALSYFSCHQPAAANTGVITRQTDVPLVLSSLRNDAVSVLVFDLPKYTLHTSAWEQQSSIQLRRNFTIKSAEHPPTVLDFQFLDRRVLLGENISILFQDLTLFNARRLSGWGIDLFLGSSGSQVILDNVMRVKLVCDLQPQPALDALKAIPNQPGYPPNTVSILPEACVQLDGSVQCYKQAIHFGDFSMPVSQANLELGIKDEGYMLHMHNVTRVCADYVDPACLQQHDGLACWAQKNFPAQQQQQQQEAVPLSAGAIAGIAIAGAVLLVGAVLCFVFRHAILLKCVNMAGEEMSELHSTGSGSPDTTPESMLSSSIVEATSPSGAKSAVLQQIRLGVLIGSGSFGRVYRARWHNADVAVKIMNCRPSELNRVLMEAEIMMQLDHANIVRALNCTVVRRTEQKPSKGSTSSSTSSNLGLGRFSGSHARTPPAMAPAIRNAPYGTGSSYATGAWAGSSGAVTAAAGGGPQGSSSNSTHTLSSLSASFASGVGPQTPQTPAAAAAAPAGAGASASASAASAVLRSAPQHLLGVEEGSDPAFDTAVGHRDSRDLGHSSRRDGSASSRQHVPGPAAAPGSGTANSSSLTAHSSCSSCGLGSGGQQGAAAGDVEAGSSGVQQQLSPPECCIGLTGASLYLEDSKQETETVEVWLVLELCGGGTLKDADPLRKRDKYNMAVLLSRLLEVARGMAYLHSKNVLHGDLKAANVLLVNSIHGCYGQTSKLSDFGLAAVLLDGATHRSTQRTGTISHTAPEVLLNGKLSPAADVYSFGIMMWELWSGASAYSHLHYGAVVSRVMRGERPPVLPYAPDEYTLLMNRCWAADPKERPSFEQVMQCLEIMLDIDNYCVEPVPALVPDARSWPWAQQPDGGTSLGDNPVGDGSRAAGASWVSGGSEGSSPMHVQQAAAAGQVQPVRGCGELLGLTPLSGTPDSNARSWEQGMAPAGSSTAAAAAAAGSSAPAAAGVASAGGVAAGVGGSSSSSSRPDQAAAALANQRVAPSSPALISKYVQDL